MEFFHIVWAIDIVIALAQAGRTAPAIALAALPAVPAMLAALVLVIALVSGVRWN